MEIINRLEILISSIGIVIGILLTFLLLVKQKYFSKTTVFLAIYFLVFSVRMAKSLFYQHVEVNYTIHQMFLSSLLLVGPSIWLYYSSILLNKQIQKLDFFIHYSPFLILVFFNFSINFSYYDLFYLGIFLHGLLYSTTILYRLIKVNHHLKKWLLLLTTTTLVLFINSILIFFNKVPFYPTSAFLFSFIMLVLFVYGLNNISLFKKEEVKYANSNLDKEEANRYHQKLKKIIEEDKLYLDSELSLTKLSKEIGISSKQLSQVINQTENSNYSQYIMRYRVVEVKRRLRASKYDNYKISAIAFDCGFNSISSFNNAFKKITNTTAIQYKSSFSKPES